MTEGPTCRLLLVEDDTGIGRLLERGLTAEGYQVDWVRDLRGATESARAGTHDLVLLDRMLPDGDGAAFCRALRRFGSRAPICMLTARETLEDKLAGFDAGADDYLTKPFEFEELLARLTALRRRGSPEPQTILRHPDSRQLSIGPSRLKFTRREWPLICYFLDHEGRALARDELIAQVWAPDSDISENSVDVYVGYLRKKLAPLDPSLRIETVRGVGFMLVRS